MKKVATILEAVGAIAIAVGKIILAVLTAKRKMNT